MMFSSLVFLYVFFPINIVFYFICKNNTYRNIVLLGFSLLFYAWGEPFFVCVLVFSCLINYIFAVLIDKYRGSYKCKLALTAAVIIDLALLGYFKYYNFFAGNINLFFYTGINSSRVGLPIGISFYTFRIISYVVDVYRKDVPVQNKFYKLLLYMSLYHHIMAGPIVRYKDIEHEIDNRVITPSGMSYGISRFITGLLKKVIIANTAGKTAAVFLKSNFTELSILGAWLGIIMYTLQIYFDFSGYSDMVIGLGRIFGFTYKENFNYPYIAKSVQDFWRRWHISLGSFFRDYVYIPLGGNRKHFVQNVMVVWLLTGFWHGASYNFIFWGLYYGILLLMERTLLSKLIKKLPALAAHIYLLLIVIVGWAFFYFSNLSQGIDFVKILFGVGRNPLYDFKFEVEFFNNIIFLIIAAAACTPVFKNAVNKINTYCAKRHILYYLLEPVFNTVGLIIATIMLVGQTYTPFLYFKF